MRVDSQHWAGRLRASAPLWVIGALCALMAVHLFLRASAFPYSPDSASYFEQARSLMHAGAALETPGVLGGGGQRPSILFPIGYPALLALVSLPGFDPAASALALSRLAGLLLPLLLFVSFRNALGNVRAMLLAGLVSLSPGLLLYATLGSPDLPALLLAVATIALILNARTRSRLVLSGILAGSAYAIRNAHLALLLAVALYYVYRLATQGAQRRETWLDASAFLLGVTLILAPVLLRNIMLFGALNPYEMAPSTLSVPHNIRTYVQEAIYDLSAWRPLGIFLGWSAAGAVMLAGAGASAAWFLRRDWKRLAPAQRNTLVLCAAYAVIGAGVVIAARSRYEWGEMINTRHTLQYTPFLWAALLAAIPAHAPRIRPGFAAAASMLLVIAPHLAYAAVPHDLLMRMQRSAAATAAYAAGKVHFCAPTNALPASNWGHVFSVLCGTAVRNIEMEAFPCRPTAQMREAAGSCAPAADAALQIARRFPGRPLKLGFFSGRGMAAGQFPLAPDEQVRLERAGWQIMQNDAQSIVLIRSASSGTPIIQ